MPIPADPSVHECHADRDRAMRRALARDRCSSPRRRGRRRAGRGGPHTEHRRRLDGAARRHPVQLPPPVRGEPATRPEGDQLPELPARHGLPYGFNVDLDYATNSTVFTGIPNEYQLALRRPLLRQARGAPLDLTATAGYAFAPQSVDGELSLRGASGRAAAGDGARDVGRATTCSARSGAWARARWSG